MLLLDTENTITFNLALTGTSSVPTVRVFLALETVAMFQASHDDTGKWSVSIKLPPETKPGMYKYSVEVSVGGRVFTPIKDSPIEIKSIEIKLDDLSFSAASTPAFAPASIAAPAQNSQSSTEQNYFVPEHKTAKSGIADELLKIFAEAKDPALKKLLSPVVEQEAAPAPVKEAQKPIPRQDTSPLTEDKAAAEMSLAEKMQILAGIRPVPKR